MSTATTILHVLDHGPDEVERALDTIFAAEERPRTLRLEGTYSAVLARACDPALAAAYRYLIARPHAGSAWTPLLEVGARADGLDLELSRALGGAAVFTTFVYGAGVSGYRLARDGALVDRYLSDPSFFAAPDDDAEGADGAGDETPGGLIGEEDPETVRGHPARFADLLPAGTAPDDFARIVLRPGWWERHDAATEDEEMEDDEVDEDDRMRCIGLALELWAPAEYPFARDLEDIPNKEIGPAIALAFV